MTRGEEFLARSGLTILVVAALVGVLALSGYDWDFNPAREYGKLFLKGLGVTLAVTAIAFVVGLVVGVGVALARLSRAFWIRHFGDLYVEIIRGTPFLVQVLIAYFGIAPLIGVENKFFVGAIALGFFAAAYMGEIFRAGIESVDRGQFEAARSLGLSRPQMMRHIVFPQAFRRMIPPLTGELIALTKESSLLYAIGVAELMLAGRQMGADTYRNFEAYLIVAAFYLVITIPLSVLARGLERRLGTSARGGVHL